jgi:acyl carrier protein
MVPDLREGREWVYTDPWRSAYRMDRQTRIIETIRAVARQWAALSPEESLFESGTLDSFALTDLVVGLESEFALRIPDSDLDPRKFESIARIEAYLDTRL